MEGDKSWNGERGKFYEVPKVLTAGTEMRE